MYRIRLIVREQSSQVTDVFSHFRFHRFIDSRWGKDPERNKEIASAFGWTGELGGKQELWRNRDQTKRRRLWWRHRVRILMFFAPSVNHCSPCLLTYFCTVLMAQYFLKNLYLVQLCQLKKGVPKKFKVNAQSFVEITLFVSTNVWLLCLSVSLWNKCYGASHNRELWGKHSEFISACTVWQCLSTPHKPAHWQRCILLFLTFAAEWMMMDTKFSSEFKQ